MKKIDHDTVNKKYVCVEIKDNGIGMDNETLQKVFETFSRPNQLVKDLD